MAYGARRFNAEFSETPVMPILCRINPVTRFDTYLFKVYSNIDLPSTPRPPQRSVGLSRCIMYLLNDWYAPC